VSERAKEKEYYAKGHGEKELHFEGQEKNGA